MTTHPEVGVAVDHHGALDQLVGTLQQVVARHHAGVVDQYVHIAHLAADAIRRAVHALPLAHVAQVREHLGLEGRHLLDPAARRRRRPCPGDRRKRTVN